jgi:hypothetical protein
MVSGISIQDCFKSAFGAVIASPRPAIGVCLAMLLGFAVSLGARFVSPWIALPAFFIIPLSAALVASTALRILAPNAGHSPGDDGLASTYSRFLQASLFFDLVGILSQLPAIPFLLMTSSSYPGESDTAGLVMGVSLSIAGYLAAAAYTLRYSLVGFLIVDHAEYSLRDAFECSEALTRGHRKELFLLMLSALPLFGPGLLCFLQASLFWGLVGVFGLLLPVPVVAVMGATAYRRLLKLGTAELEEDDHDPRQIQSVIPDPTYSHGESPDSSSQAPMDIIESVPPAAPAAPRLLILLVLGACAAFLLFVIWRVATGKLPL